jgi:hypothetical protein
MVPAPERTRDGTAARTVSVVLLPRPRGGPVSRSIEDATAQRGVEADVLGPTDHTAVRRLDVGFDAHPADVLGAALAMTDATWIAFIEWGDRWHPDHLRTAIDLAEAKGASWAYCAATLLGADGAVVGRREAAPEPTLRMRLRHVNVIGGATSVVCRREVLTAGRPLDRRLSALVLWAAWIELARLPSAAGRDALVAERWDEDRSVLAADATRREVALLHAEGMLQAHDGHPFVDLGDRFAELGHARDAARLHALSAFAGKDPRGLPRAAGALRRRNETRPALPVPEWLRV